MEFYDCYCVKCQQHKNGKQTADIIAHVTPFIIAQIDHVIMRDMPRGRISACHFWAEKFRDFFKFLAPDQGPKLSELSES